MVSGTGKSARAAGDGAMTSSAVEVGMINTPTATPIGNTNTLRRARSAGGGGGAAPCHNHRPES